MSRGTTTSQPSEQRQEIEKTWPLLTYHYGFSVDELVRMPRWLRKIYVNKLPELLAQTQIRAIEAAAFTSMEKGSRRSIMRSLNRALGTTESVEKPKTAGEYQGAMPELGIGVQFVDKDGNPTEAPKS